LKSKYESGELHAIQKKDETGIIIKDDIGIIKKDETGIIL